MCRYRDPRRGSLRGGPHRSREVRYPAISYGQCGACVIRHCRDNFSKNRRCERLWTSTGVSVTRSIAKTYRRTIYKIIIRRFRWSCIVLEPTPRRCGSAASWINQRRVALETPAPRGNRLARERRLAVLDPSRLLTGHPWSVRCGEVLESVGEVETSRSHSLSRVVGKMKARRVGRERHSIPRSSWVR